jgi:CBS domain-containing protein/sporulation protein YlmC with PRC-barrel domain
MLYLSELIGKRIYDGRGNSVARIGDFITEVSDSPLRVREEESEGPVVHTDEVTWAEELDVPVIKGIIARTSRKNKPFYLSIDAIASLGRDGARLRSFKVDLQPFERRAGEIILKRDLWDKQVIDLNSRRVYRVNDVLISTASGETSPDETRWWVRGVDVGFGGFVRRLHIAKLIQSFTGKVAHPHVVRWQHLDFFGSNVPGGVALPHKKLAQLHPVEIARITDAVSYLQGAEIIASLDDTLAADTLEEIDAERQTDIVEQIPDERAADILEEMAPDEATDLLSELTEEKAGALLNHMDEAEAAEVRQLMRYPESSAGGIMTTQFVRVLADMTIDEVLDANRATLLSADLIYYMYVVESEETDKLVGIITVRDLLIHDRTSRVGDFMLREFLSARPGENEREVARKMAQYNLMALPVVDLKGTVLGVVTVDDALEALLPEGWQRRLPRIFS